MFEGLSADIKKAVHQFRADRGISQLTTSHREFSLQDVARIQTDVTEHLQAVKGELTAHDVRWIDEAGTIANKNSALSKLNRFNHNPTFYSADSDDGAKALGRMEDDLRTQFVAGGIKTVDPAAATLEEPYETAIRSVFRKATIQPVEAYGIGHVG